MQQSPRLWIISVLAIFLLVAWLGSHAITTPKAALAEAASTGQALIGGHFELENVQGFTMTEKNFSGKYMLVYFGYTHCPDMCPTALLVMQNALMDLGKDADQIVPIFITIDPERDTPKVMSEYVPHFGTKLIGLTGSSAQIKQVTDAYKVYYAKEPAPHSKQGYSMDHSGFIYLMGPDGNYVAHFPYTISEDQLKDALANHLR